MLHRDCRILQAAVDINRAGKKSFLVVCVRLNQLKILPDGSLFRANGRLPKHEWAESIRMIDFKPIVNVFFQYDGRERPEPFAEVAELTQFGAVPPPFIPIKTGYLRDSEPPET
jgi:hypothetical protein